jgi:hypothetical protein
VISSNQESLPDNAQYSQQTDIHNSGEILTHYLSKRVALDVALDRAANGTDRKKYYCI